MTNLKGIATALGVWIFMGALASSVDAQPINDRFSNRQTITDTNIFSSLADATSEPDELLLEGISTGQTAWWTWIAPSNGIVTLNSIATSFYPLLTVYTGHFLNALSLVASNNYLICYADVNCGCHWRARRQITFRAARGQVYQIAADSLLYTDTVYALPPVPYPPTLAASSVGFEPLPPYGVYPRRTRTTNILAGDNINLQFQFTPAPENDDFANAIHVSGSRAHVIASNRGATKEAGEPNHLGNPGGSSVWYSWKPPAAGRVTLSINQFPNFPPPTWYGSVGYSLNNYFTISLSNPVDCGAAIDQNPPPQFFPVFAAYTGSSVAALTSVNPLPLTLAAFPYAVEFDVAKGQTYQIAFDGNHGTTAETPLYLTFTKPAANNEFRNRIPLRGINLFATSHNAGATSESGEPTPATGSIGKTVWWSWQAPVSGPVTLDVSQSDYPFPVTVYTGSRISNLKPVTRGIGSVTFNGVAGRFYQIAVSDSAGLTGAIRLTLQAPVVELHLLRNQSLYPRARLLYAATPGQIVLLQRSQDEGNWQNVAQVLARRTTVEFLTKPAPIPGRIIYRAIIVDLLHR